MPYVYVIKPGTYEQVNGNLIFDFHPDALGEKPQFKKDSVNLLKKIIVDFSLTDVWRII